MAFPMLGRSHDNAVVRIARAPAAQADQEHQRYPIPRGDDEEDQPCMVQVEEDQVDASDADEGTAADT